MKLLASLCAKIVSLYVCMCVQPQITGETVGEVKPVADMHQRKAEMARNSDCFIALPGPIHFSLLCINRSRELVSFLVLVVINDVFCVYNFFFIPLLWLQVAMALWRSY